MFNFNLDLAEILDKKDRDKILDRKSRTANRFENEI